ncbi:hypothetical protein [Sulfitobacter sabulilitoris]|uniref:Uncharacterized protein n=1 Tax=Sulfitobacter sabulilitoris TaxID=2562655 RepID=A0A5S3PIM8_9RHOB|nr:hypothetical protein [Sulfitobacter sabulilitoris]TMM54239.1 hypothetical protein FDT80_01175 [Sulfitobacter sabulilitoris]
MSKEAMAIVVFGAILCVALVMFVLERRGVAARRAARGGREVDVSDLIAFGSAAGDANRNRAED